MKEHFIKFKQDVPFFFNFPKNVVTAVCLFLLTLLCLTLWIKIPD